MNSSYHPSFQSVHVQLLITIFLAVLLWALYQRLRKVEFFRWWAWAWTCSALFLAAAIESVKVGPDWTPLKISLLVAVLVFGMMQSLLLALGGLSWSVPGRSLQKMFRSACGSRWCCLPPRFGSATLCARIATSASPLAIFRER